MRHDVIIVGAGAAGIGMGCVLHDLGVDFQILEKSEIGASFKQWPEEMRFITPSFNSTPFGLLDLNAVALHTSPANFLKVEHPSGQHYARYLETLSEELDLPVKTGIQIQQIQYSSSERQFTLTADGETFRARYVIWAGGEFQYPKLDPFPGAALCLHNSKVNSWQDVDGTERIVIGAFESGLDAAVHLCRAGKQVTVLNADSSLKTEDQDPSCSVSPFTRGRVDQISRQTGRISIKNSARVVEVKKRGDFFQVLTEFGQTFESAYAPILATGFKGSVDLVREHFEWDDVGNIVLSETDESTLVPGLFLVGPQVRHGSHIFCYVYKFRQRFAVVADVIASELGLDVQILREYHANGMYLDDLSCCGAACRC